MESFERIDPDILQFRENRSDEQKAQLPSDLEAEIDGERARLELLHEGNPGAIREFEDREKKISVYRNKERDLTRSNTDLAAKIAEIRAKWEPELDTLFAQISTAFAASFERIGCAGAVSVYKDGEDGRDFENWEARVQVRFRENEQLSVLDSQRQSGGERAVSTIFYLMALQSLSRAPFRVVDEINQGMDPRNERMVHERMVEIACGGPDSDSQGSQYFLITPKLLTGLKYSPGMKVHCIASGENMPVKGDTLDFAKVLTKARALRTVSAAA
ncbi:hypothetical protein MRB53_038431 [Persea americana]|nr:hypothetical protein MRB53_038431 [Persea americana]